MKFFATTGLATAFLASSVLAQNYVCVWHGTKMSVWEDDGKYCPRGVPAVCAYPYGITDKKNNLHCRDHFPDRWKFISWANMGGEVNCVSDGQSDTGTPNGRWACAN